MTNNKCPYCGGNLEVKDDRLNAVCDSCGEIVSLAELNNLKIKKHKISTYENEDDKLDHDYNSAFVSQEELRKLTNKKLFEQVNLALNTQDWVLAEKLCDEMIRRDPQNANAYLSKILANVQVSRKEDLPNINRDTLDCEYFDNIYRFIDEEGFFLDEDAEYQYNHRQPKNLYQLFIKFADESLKQEIQHYNKLIEAKAEERKRQEDIKKAQQEEEFKRQEEERRKNAIKENRKEKTKSLLKWLIPIAIIAVLIIVVVCILTNKKAENEELYKSENFVIEVTDKTNTESDNLFSTYAYIFKFKVTNNSTKEMTRLVGVMTVDNINNEHLFVGEISLSGSVASSNYGSWNVTAYSSSNDTGLELYNTQYSGLNIYFRITKISFADGVYKEYENQDTKIKSADTNYVNPKYTNAMNLYNQGKYNEAKKEFEALGDYKDSADMLRLCNQKILEINQNTYQQAINFMNQGNYSEAYNLFKSIEDYSDSNQKIIEIQSTVEDNAKTLINNGAYSQIIENLSSVGFNQDNSPLYVACYNIIQWGKYEALVNYGITNVTLDINSNKIESNAFKNCTKLNSVNITNKITSIGESAFSGCKGLANVLIPTSVKEISTRAFYNCGNDFTIYCSAEYKPTAWSSTWNGDISSVVWNVKEIIDKGVSQYYINNNNQKVLYKLKDIEILSFTIDNDTNIIHENAFNSCTKLTEIDIPKNIIEIENNAFYQCTSLQYVRFANDSRLESIGDYSFYKCNKLNSIKFPKTLNNIGKNAFYYCSNLSSITFETNCIIQNIGDYAFSYTAITTFDLPKSVEILNQNCFTGCANLNTFNISNTLVSIKGSAFSGCDKLKTINYSGTKQEWLEVNKNSNWAPPATYKIICSDATYSVLSGWSN